MLLSEDLINHERYAAYLRFRSSFQMLCKPLDARIFKRRNKAEVSTVYKWTCYCIRPCDILEHKLDVLPHLIPQTLAQQLENLAAV
jgi:hypothetical protein